MEEAYNGVVDEIRFLAKLEVQFGDEFVEEVYRCGLSSGVKSIVWCKVSLFLTF
jgi:hypothetical protein